jgi:phosphorylcholine metabolism protein LicD
MVTESNLQDRNRVLIDLSNKLNDLQIPFMLSDGVLLEAVREGNFIKWDWDVELSIKVEDIFDKSDRLFEALKDEDFVLDNIGLKWENYKINVYKFNNKYSLIGF